MTVDVDVALSPRDVAQRARAAVLERLRRPVHGDGWQTVGELARPAGAPAIPGPMVSRIVMTLLNSHLAATGPLVCEGAGCPKMVDTYALTPAGLLAREQLRVEPWTAEIADFAAAYVRRQQKTTARRCHPERSS